MSLREGSVVSFISDSAVDSVLPGSELSDGTAVNPRNSQIAIAAITGIAIFRVLELVTKYHYFNLRFFHIGTLNIFIIE